MVCNKCGTPIKDGATFCQNCGAKVEAPQPIQPAQTVPEQAQQINYYTPEKKHVSVGGWILRYLITLIPCVGPIIFIIMLFVWSFDESYDDTSRNWAKAQLIWLAISIVLSLLVALLFGSVFTAALDSAMRSIENGGTYYYYR